MSRDIPVIFSAAMVQALLAGRKIMTRRLADVERKTRNPAIGESETYMAASPWQKVAAGDRLWVRESLFKHDMEGWRYSADKSAVSLHKDHPGVSAMISWAHHKKGWSAPSIHMPRWASRLTLIVIGTKVERLQDISPDDAWNEGVERRSRSVRQMWLFGADAAEREAIYKRACVWEFEELWKTLHGPDAWDANPEVVAVSFSVIKANIDAPEARAA